VNNITEFIQYKSQTTYTNSDILNVFVRSSNYKILLVEFVSDYGKKEVVASCS